MQAREQLLKQGFTTIPQVLNAAEVKQVRQQLIEIFNNPSSYEGDLLAKGSQGSVYLDMYSRYPQFHWIFTSDRFVNGMRSILGDDFLYLPESALHHAGYTGWHKDTNAQEKAGHDFHWQDDFEVVQVGIYLQDNDPEYAGGLDVIPGSHKVRNVSPQKKSKIGSLADRFLNKLKKQPQEYSVPSKAGDVAVFNLRTDHRATQPKSTPIPPEHAKYAIFIVCSRNNGHAKRYIDYVRTRPDYAFLKGFAYSPDLLAKGKSKGLSFFNPA